MTANVSSHVRAIRRKRGSTSGLKPRASCPDFRIPDGVRMLPANGAKPNSPKPIKTITTAAHINVDERSRIPPTFFQSGTKQRKADKLTRRQLRRALATLAKAR